MISQSLSRAPHISDSIEMTLLSQQFPNFVGVWITCGGIEATKEILIQWVCL